MGWREPSLPPKGVAQYASPGKVRAPHVPNVTVCEQKSIPTHSSHELKFDLQPATTHCPFQVRSTHSSSEGPCNPGREVGASRVYPLDVGRNTIPARVITNHAYSRAV